MKSNAVKDKLNALESLDLRLDDVGRCLELANIPVHKDGIKGRAKRVLSTVVAAGK